MADGHMIDIQRGSQFLALVWLVVGALLLPQAPALGDLDIRFDYRYDTRGFFSGANIERRQILEAAAAIFEERISSTPPSITPSGINRWTLSFDNPNTGTAVTLTNLHVPAGTMIVFVGARSLGSNFIGKAQFQCTWFGDPAWVKLFNDKDNTANFSPFGGAITFDESTPWFFDLTPESLDSFPGKYDFFSVAIHEIGHLLGFTDSSRAFVALSVEGNFLGPVSQSLYGGPIPMAEDGSHWQQDVLFEGSPPAMTPTTFENKRKSFSKLDFAALVDIGYELKLSVPKIVVQTGSQTKTVGEAVSLTVQASGSGVLSYSWRKNGVQVLNGGGVSGANGPTLSFASVQLSQAGGYSVVVSNLVGSVVSAIVQLTVNPAQAAPTIVVQPVSTAVRVGQQVTLGIQAAGSSPLSYQWQRNGANLPGATGAELVIRSTTLNDAGEYRVVISNSRGTVTSSPAFVAVLAPEYLPTITQQPQATNLVVGQRLELKVISNGNPEPGYQWRKDGVNLLGGNGSVLVKPSVVLTDAGLYQVAVTNSVGQVLSARVTVTVVPETIVSRIVGFREIVGGDLVFDLDAPSGREWVLEDSTILGTWSEVSRFLANQPRFSLRVPRQPTSSRFFRLRQADSGASAPVITQQPEGLTVKAGNNAVFTVVAEGTGPMSHQWLFNGVAIPGARQASLILANVQAMNAGDYRVVISNSVGNVTSSEAMLTVNPDKPVGPSGFVWIEPGTFVMGSPVSEIDRQGGEDQHTVTLTQGYWMSDHEVTQAEYQSVMGSNPSYFTGDLNRPVEQVNWSDAVLYCQKLTERERSAGRITSLQSYRLPTEAEWEYAARAGTTGARYGELDAIGWWWGNSGRQTHPVKQKAANAWGLHDMIGNVWEWCSDEYQVRGGNFLFIASDARSADRYRGNPGDRLKYLGFRPALSSAPVVPVGMALIPAGPFEMGDARVDRAGPEHTVTVSAFAMDKWEVSIELWESVRAWGNAHGYDLEAGGSFGAKHPVVSVTWYDVVKWSNARSEKEGKVPSYYEDAAMGVVYRSGEKVPAGVRWDVGYRLPTEAEWEKAARGGLAGKLYPWGTDVISAELANYRDSNKGKTMAVGSYGANGYGLYDMAGNVWEWAWDSWGQYSTITQTDPRGPISGSYRVVRGGGWSGSAERCRVADRFINGSAPGGTGGDIGFRSVLPPGQP